MTSIENDYFLLYYIFVSFFQGESLLSDVANRVIMSNMSLVLQKVDKAKSGKYTCISHNSEGHSESKEMHLKIKCEFIFSKFYFYDM